MSDRGYGVLYRFRYFFSGLLIVVCLPILSVSLSFIGSSQAWASGSNAGQPASGYDDNPNLVADGFEAAMDRVNQTASLAAGAIQSANQSFENALLSTAKTIGGGSQAIASGAYSGTVWATHGLGKGASFVAHAPVYAWHGVSSVAHIGSFISPAASDKAPPPVIDPVIAAEIANSKPLLSSLPAAQADNAVPQWPIRGIVTEEFGVPHWPYQPTHTGIDISDAAAPGVTPIKPFKPGRVIAVVHSDAGFGNHVIVDHGGGLLSLYGHMYSTAVQVGQLVDESTTLGLEGSTGVSTGVHVHFEIDLNGQPVNPHLYVTGQP